MDEITIHKSPTAGCQFSQVSKEQLHRSSIMHICDVEKGMQFFAMKIAEAAKRHDLDKLTGISEFHADFATGFKTTAWWDNHRRVSRHHLSEPDGVPEDVDLVDVIEHIVDCVMAGAARSDRGTAGVYDVKVLPEVLEKAVANTVEKLKDATVVVSWGGKGEANERNED